MNAFLYFTEDAMKEESVPSSTDIANTIRERQKSKTGCAHSSVGYNRSAFCDATMYDT